jgi:hypothetical protein
MNKTERAYSQRLETLRLAGEILAWRFEPLKFRLGHACYYTPDFEVVDLDGLLEYHEVKGFWRDDARVKIKTAARLFGDRRFIAVQLVKGSWSVEDINPGPA